MTSITPIADRLFGETLRAIAALDRQRADEARQIAAGIGKAASDWQAAREDVRRMREEAARILSDSLKLEEAAEQALADAHASARRALAVIAPPDDPKKLAAE